MKGYTVKQMLPWYVLAARPRVFAVLSRVVAYCIPSTIPPGNSAGFCRLVRRPLVVVPGVMTQDMPAPPRSESIINVKRQTSRRGNTKLHCVHLSPFVSNLIFSHHSSVVSLANGFCGVAEQL